MSAQTFRVTFFLSLAILGQSCLSRKKAPSLPVEPEFRDELLAVGEVTFDSLTFDELDTIPLVTLLASIEKTHCYGICPEFKVDFYTDSTVIYRGFYDVDKIGDYASKINTATYKQIIELAERIGFYDMEAYYPVRGEIIDDLPVTITSMDLIYKENRVTNAHHSPTKLHKFERFLLEVIDLLEWERVSSSQ